MDISIVIPAYNEAENIGSLVNEIVIQFNSESYEIVVVDDASKDNTATVLAELKQHHPQLDVITQKETFGQSIAIATGVRSAEADVIVTLDGDGQNDPADIPRMIAALSENKMCQMVVGHRKKRRDSFWRVLSSKIANSVRSALLNDHTPDTGCGLKAFYKASFLALPHFDHMHRFLPALIKMYGGDVMSVPVKHRARQHGQSKYGTLDRLGAGLVDLVGVSWLRLRSKKFAKTAHS